MARLFASTDNTIHKWAHHIPIYESTFSPYRNQPIKMLEIGVSCGGSLELWRKFFCPEATIVGIDANPQCVYFDDPDNNVHVRIGQQQNPEFLQAVVDELGPFNIILDDGSHLPSYTLHAFQHLFLNGLSDGGVYLVEDLCWCYMPCGQEPFENEHDANDGSPTFVEFTKILIDAMHAQYTRTKPQSTDAFEVDNPLRNPKVRVPLATTLIDRIDLHDGIVAIHRNPRGLPRLHLMIPDEDFFNEWLTHE
jgi:hypothetical protein